MCTLKKFYHPVLVGGLQLEGNLFLAPVAGYSDRAFRSVCIEGGANFTYTEMVSSEALVRSSEKTEELMQRAENEKRFAVQIFGGNPQTMAQAARLVVQKAAPDLIDINAGCPVPKIVKTGAGSSLTRDSERLFAVTQAVVREVSPLPVTVKIRSGWDSQNLNWKEAALAALEAGAAAITIHPRTRAQGYEGFADWTILGKLVSLIAGRIPVFGSGDAFSPGDAQRMLEQTGCDGVMFARGAMGNPFIFEETRCLLVSGTAALIPPHRRIEAGFRELERLVGDRGEEAACREMRKRFCAYSKGIESAARLRERIVQAKTVAEYRGIFTGLGLV